MIDRIVGRFAPSTTGEAHPGTLLSALLVWLDARSRGGRALLRLEDLDTTRVKPAYRDQLIEACAAIGCTWDDVVIQSDRTRAHEAALDRLAAIDRLYVCTCSRKDRGPGAYDNRCRPNTIRDWRATSDPLRARLDDDHVALIDALGVDLSQTPATELGDPIVRRRDGAIAYMLAVVVDDADAGITDVIRGRDIASSTATQILLQRLLDLPTPVYRHHLLLLEPQGDKLAKLHGSIPFTEVRKRYAGPELRDLLLGAVGVRSSSPGDFDWAQVLRTDLVVRWVDGELVFG